MDKEQKITLIFFIAGMIWLIIFFILPWESQLLGIKIVLLICAIICFFVTIYMILERLGGVELLDDLIS